MIDHYQTDFSVSPLVFASRRSALALAQTEQVRRALKDTPTEILRLSTIGDEVLDRPLVDVGGKGVFIKTLETAILSGRADAAVHSLKDMETHLATGTEIAAVLPRGDRGDALVGPYSTIDELPQGARIGTASVRRAACLLHHRPDLDIALLRGNVNSRIARLDTGEFSAIVLAIAGLKRLKLDCAYHRLDETIMPAAAGQGAIAVQVTTSGSRADAVRVSLAAVHCAQTADCITAERAVLAALDGSCRTPIAAMADLDATGKLSLSAVVLSADGQQKFNAASEGSRTQAEQIGTELGQRLLQMCGGKAFLA
jgi:hydroxymethylbilane synthase